MYEMKLFEKDTVSLERRGQGLKLWLTVYPKSGWKMGFEQAVIFHMGVALLE